MKKQRKQLLFYLLLLCVSTLASQNITELKGIIIDENSKPLANANVFLLQSKRGTITNSEGKFAITINRQDVLSVSHMGYETISTKVSTTTDHLRLILKTSVNRLSEIVVTNLSAEGIFKEALRKISDNYNQSTFMTKVMYRAEGYHKDTLLYLEETAFNIVKSYKPKFNDKYFLLKNRNFRFTDNTYIIHKIGRYDLVSEAHNIYNNSFFKRYNITRLPSTSFDNRIVYVLLAESKNKDDSSYIKVYIDADDMAFVRFESIAKSGDKVTGQYKKIDNKYYLTDGYSVHYNHIKGKVLPVESNMIVTEITHDLSSNDIDGVLVDKDDVMKEYATHEQDTMFWREHNALLPDSTVMQALQSYRLKEIASKTQHDTMRYAAGIRQLYKLNHSLMISSDLQKDFYSLNYNSVAISRSINYLLKQNTRWPLLASTIYYLLSMPFEESLSEYRLLNISDLSAKINPTVFNKHLSSYIYGINENTLNDFKRNNPNNFLRLHTIRNDGHYNKSLMMEEELAKADLSNKNNLMDFLYYYAVELSLHRFANIYNPFGKDTQLSTANNRPLINNRSYSWVKYLFEPEATYQDHVLEKDLTDEEYRFIKRSTWLSLMNIISPQMIGLKKFSLNDKSSFTFSLNYLRIPFGEMFGQNIWLTTNYKQLHGIFIKQYKNYENTSLGLGYKLYDLPLSNNISLTTSVDYWSQPSKLTFHDANLRHGFHFGQMLELQLLYNKYIQANSLSILVGYDYKTTGYMPQSYFVGNRFDLKAAFKWRF